VITREENNYYISLIPAQRNNFKLHITPLLFGHLVIRLQKIPCLCHSCIAIKSGTLYCSWGSNNYSCSSSPLVLLGANQGEGVVDYVILERRNVAITNFLVYTLMLAHEGKTCCFLSLCLGKRVHTFQFWCPEDQV